MYENLIYLSIYKITKFYNNKYKNNKISHNNKMGQCISKKVKVQ